LPTGGTLPKAMADRVSLKLQRWRTERRQAKIQKRILFCIFCTFVIICTFVVKN